ncbi:MAG: ribosome assembly RNA-binding protein YhbY [Candidatus Lambdaproteobacteria bacterium]|nr:ribosome assembly RNA-binding protein YhbY [Candidatus Lambdaproteobacteria bacterium]
MSGKQKRYLRGLGHKLKPVVTVGKQGLGPAVISQVEANLLAHELIKIRLLESCPLGKDECAEAVMQATGAELAQSLGHTQLYYRPHPEQPTLALPAGD